MTAEGRGLLALGVALALALAAPTLAFGAEAAAFLDHRSGLVAAFEAVAGPVCHHLPDRTPVVSGRPLPVCARCTGLYAGGASGGMLGLALGGVVAADRRRLATVAGGALVLTAVAGVAAVLEALGLLATGNVLRLALGVPLGLGPTLLGGLGARVLIGAARG